MSFHSNWSFRVIVFITALVAPPLALAQPGDAQKQKARQTTAMLNARQIGLAMLEFENEYGEFPNEKTAAPVKEATGTEAELKAATANDCFFQLIAAGMVEDDRIFSFDAPAGQGRKPPLKVGKCSYACFSGMVAAGDATRPLVVAPLIKGKNLFDPQVLGGKAVILRVDNSVTTLPIDKDGRVLINGLDIFDPAQPFWKGKVPEIKWPEN